MDINEEERTAISISVTQNQETGLWNAGVVVSGFRDRLDATMIASAIQTVLIREFDAEIDIPLAPENTH